MQALLAGWRVSLRRTRADWPIVAAAWLITLLAATLLAGGAIYPSAAAEAGLRRALAEAPVTATGIEVTHYSADGQGATADGVVQGAFAPILAPVGGSLVRDWRSSATLRVGTGIGEDGDQAVLGFLDGLPEHTRLLAGVWPPADPPDTTTGGRSPDTIRVALVDTVATELGLEVGEEAPLVARASSDAVTIPALVVGIFAINDPADPYWNADQQLVSGIRQTGGYRTLGPFFTTAEDLERPAVGSLNQHWRAVLDFDRLRVDDAGPLRNRLGALEARLEAGGGADFQVSSGLQPILAGVERSLLVSRTGVLLLVAQLAILAAYAIVLTASLLVDHRRIDTALLRSRGAGPWQVAGLAVTEGLLLATPAVLVAPWLAAGALNVLNDAGPLAEVGLRIEPHVGMDAYLAAGLAGLGCVALLALPALLAARGFAAEQGGLSRQETRTFGQRMGIDIALLALTGIALWQLRLYGAPLTQTVQGQLGIDPLLVAAPAIGMVAGGVLALRVLPLLAQAVEAGIARGRDLVLSLGSRQLARRPLRYTRSALLLMLAMSMGVFALSYGATWSGSQRDQAAYQTGADVRVRPDGSGAGPELAALAGAYRAVPGVAALTPVERLTNRVAFVAARASDILAIDAERAPEIVHVRADEASSDFGTLFAALRAGRPEPSLAPLPGDAAALRLTAAVSIGSIERFVFDALTGEFTTEPIDPAELTGVRVRVAGTVRDPNGLAYPIESALVPMAGPTTEIATALPAGGGPFALLTVGLELWLPEETLLVSGSAGISAAAAGPTIEGPWTDVPLEGTWAAKQALGLSVMADVPSDQVAGTSMTLTGSGFFGGIFGTRGVPSARIAFLPASLGNTLDPTPVLPNRAFLEGTSSEVGDTLTATVEGGPRHLVIAGAVESFPTTDPLRPLLIFDQPTFTLVRLQGSGTAEAPTEWWLATADGTDEAVAAAFREPAFASSEVVSLGERTRTLSTDPVALGIIGALTLGFVVTGLFAVVGLAVSGAVSARQRRTEFALLRALGLSGRQLFGSLWLENGSVVLVSLVAGTSLGLLIGWTVLPFITVTQQATAPIPPVLVEIPWDQVVALEIVSAIALGIAVVLIAGVLRRFGVGSVLRMGED